MRGLFSTQCGTPNFYFDWNKSNLNNNMVSKGPRSVLQIVANSWGSNCFCKWVPHHQEGQFQYTMEPPNHIFNGKTSILRTNNCSLGP